MIGAKEWCAENNIKKGQQITVKTKNVIFKGKFSQVLRNIHNYRLKYDWVELEPETDEHKPIQIPDVNIIYID